jgi:DNA repair exonuclease SbcCD ATPase subunit
MQSPRGGSSSGGRVSIVNYDGRRIVSSPTSLEACRIEGVLPESLLLRDLQRGEVDASHDPYASCTCATTEQLQIKRDFIERKRKALVALVHATREKLVSTRKGDTLRLPHLSPMSPDGKAGSAVPTPPHSPGMSPRGASPRASPRAVATPRSQVSPRNTTTGSSSPKAPGSFHNVTLPATNVEVAQYYDQLKNQADAEARKQAKWDEKMARVAERAKAAAEQRAQRAAASGEAHDAKLSTVLQRAQALDSERNKKFEETWRKEEEKLQTIAEERTLRQSQRPKPNRGVKERAAAEKQEVQRLDALREKLAKANEASQELQEKSAKERERRAFLSELQNAAYREQNLRAQRAKGHRMEQLEQRIQEAGWKRVEAEADRDAMLFEKTLQREVVSRQKQEVAEFVRTHGRTSPTLPPPAWLEPQLRALREKQKGSSGRGPHPPSSPRSELSPRSTLRSSETSPRAFKVREKFTIGDSSEPSVKQAFPAWMFQSE